MLREYPLTARQRLRAWAPLIRAAAYGLAVLALVAAAGRIGGAA